MSLSSPVNLNPTLRTRACFFLVMCAASFADLQCSGNSCQGGKQEELYDAQYSGIYAKEHWDVGKQNTLWFDLLSYPGPRPFFPSRFEQYTVLDAGAGRGAVVSWLRNQTIVPIAAKGVELSGVAVNSCPWPHLVEEKILQRASLDDLPFASEEFDLVYSHEVLEHVPTSSIPATLVELLRVSRGRLFFSISLRLAGKDDPESPHLHVTVESRGWWDDQMANIGCIPDLDVLRFMFKDPRSRHADHPPWRPFAEPWLFAYTCFQDMSADEGRMRALAELEDLRNAFSPDGSVGCTASQGWCDLFHPALYWETDRGMEFGFLDSQHRQFLAATFETAQ